MYKIIIFDFDGTIADTNKCIIETFQQSLVELGFDTMEEKDIIDDFAELKSIDIFSSVFSYKTSHLSTL